MEFARGAMYEGPPPPGAQQAQHALPHAVSGQQPSRVGVVWGGGGWGVEIGGGVGGGRKATFKQKTKESIFTKGRRQSDADCGRTLRAQQS